MKLPRKRIPAPPPTHAQAQAWRDYTHALAGRLPGEFLDGAWRGLLVAELTAAGWNDEQIAVHTRWTTYTVARIRTAMGLPANHEQREVA